MNFVGTVPEDCPPRRLIPLSPQFENVDQSREVKEQDG